MFTEEYTDLFLGHRHTTASNVGKQLINHTTKWKVRLIYLTIIKTKFVIQGKSIKSVYVSLKIYYSRITKIKNYNVLNVKKKNRNTKQQNKHKKIKNLEYKM